MVEVTPAQLIQVFIFPWFVMVAFWLIKNRKRLTDKWNLTFNKARTVKVNFLTSSGRNIERFVKPDSRAIMHINGGSYTYHKDFSSLNAEHRIPEVWVMENQPHPVGGDIVRLVSKTKVKEPQTDGSVKEVDAEVPTILLSFTHSTAQKLMGKTALEIEEMLNSKIINDIVNASSKQMQKLEMMFYIMLGVGGLCVIGFLTIYNQGKDIHTQLELLKLSLVGASQAIAAGGG